MKILCEPTEIARLLRIWTSILYRCTNPKNKQYKNYGGRGITICQEWKDFNLFCRDVIEGSEKGLHLDRIDNNQGYFKENCRWTTPKTNHRNKRNNKYFQTHLGKICESELIEKIGYTRTQYRRAVEKYGIDCFLEMFKKNQLPKKRIYEDMNLLIGKKIGNLTILSLDSDKSTGARYFCVCDCGKRTRISRFKLINNLVNHCISCARSGDMNPNSLARRK